MHWRIGYLKPIVYLLCGLTASGKTTYAKKLEQAGVVRLSVDEEVYARHGRYGVDYPEWEYFERERPVVAEMRHRMLELVRSGVSVVFNHGLWTRTDREYYKRLIEDAGGTWRLLYFRADRALLLVRLAERNQRTDTNALRVTPEALDDFFRRFEEPIGEGEDIVDTE